MGKYEEALERAKAGKPLDEVFPELKESEDEKIRKWLVDYFAIIGKSWIHREFTCEQILAYLEKQKVNTEGDFARGYDCGYECCLNSHGTEWLEKQKEQKPNIELIQKSWYLEGYHDGKYNNEPKWLIQTGKGGPMYEENPKYGTQNPAEWSEDFENNIRNLLHDKLTGHSEDGSMSWAISIDDKTLKDIVNGIWFYVGKEALKYSNKELSQPEWSEEDERLLNIIIDILDREEHNGHLMRGDLKACVKLLKSLRPQPHWKPSEEQMETLERWLLDNEFKEDSRYVYPIFESLYNDLKKLM